MKRDRGFALVAVLVASVALAGTAYDVILQSRTGIVTAQAEVDRAHMEAAADAGLAIAEVSLLARDGAWRFDGTPRRLSFDGVDLSIGVEDERGKIPINVLSDSEARRLFEAAGASGAQLDTLVDSFLAWRQTDNSDHPLAPTEAQYLARGTRPREGDITATGELLRINGMTPAIYRRIAPHVTLFFGESGGFEEKTASPFALRVMTGLGEDSPAAIARAREASGERPALSTDDPASAPIAGRRFTVRVSASDARGGRLARATIIEPTGDAAQPILVRSVE